MTDPAVCSCETLEPSWDVPSLLRRVAALTPTPAALIDAGALVTGLSNRAVAAALLEAGLRAFDGVVFLDDDDRKVILLRAGGRVLPLERCGVPL